jgi:hypothetical protein
MTKPDANGDDRLNLSTRVYHRILKLARTIADLAACEEIQSVHLADVLHYRPKLMMGHQYFEQADSAMPAVSQITLFLLTRLHFLC